MSSITAFVMHPNKQWFDTDEQAILADFADPDTATFLIRRQGHFQVKLQVNQELIVGRCHSGKGPQPQVDLSPYNAASYGTSRLHVVLRHDAQGWWLEDLQSSNGTWVNGEQLKAYTPVHLDVRNRVMLGNLPLSILLPHKVFSGIVMLVNVNIEQTASTHVVNIEGDPALQRILDITFQAAESSINLHHFATGDEAVPYITANAHAIDLFILDIALPGTMNGLEVASRIRALGCPGAIIFTSSDTSPSSEILASLKSEFLPKPSHILELAPRLFNYRISRKTAPESHANRPDTLEDSVTLGNRPWAGDSVVTPEPQELPHIQHAETPGDQADRLLAEGIDQSYHATGEIKPPAKTGELQKSTRLSVPLNYLQRLITAIRRL